MINLNEKGDIMKNDNDVINSGLYTMASYVTYFLAINACFLISIFPLLIYKIIFNGSSIIILFILSIAIGPGLSTLFSTMEKLIREKEISPLKDYIHFYKMNLLQGSAFSVLVNILIGMLYYDLIYFISIGQKILMIFVGLIILLTIIFAVNGYLIISRYVVKMSFLIRISLRMALKKGYLSLTCFAVIIIGLWIIRVTHLSLIGFLFGPTLISFFILKIQLKYINELQETIINEYINKALG